MAIVIPLAPRRRSPSQPAPLPCEAATILFFTWVRYERQGDCVPAARPARRKRPASTAVKTVAGTKSAKGSKTTRQPA